MGLFLAMSSVAGGTRKEVEACIASYAAEQNGSLKAASAQLDDDQEARLLETAGGVTFVYPDDFMAWDELSAKLSADLNKPVFSFHIHDGDLWMFILFVQGKEAAKFNTIPDYWGDIEPGERAQWLPTAEDIARHMHGIQSEQIAPYLVHWPVDGLPGKARPEDDFEFIDWQVIDFMRQLGFGYPGPGQGTAYRFEVT